MNSDKDPIKKRFASKLTGFAPEVPASVWDRIDADLTAKQGHQAPPRKKIWLRAATWVATAAAIILAVLMFRSEDFKPEVAKPMAVAEKANNVQNVYDNSNPLQQSANINKINPPAAIYVSAKKNHTIVNKNNTSLQAKQIRVISNKELPLIENVHKDLLAEKTRTKGIEIINEKFAEKELARKIAEMLAGSQNEVFFANNSTARSSNGLEFGVNGNSGFARANNTDQVKQGAGVVLRNSLVTMKHEQPITLGFNLNKKLTDKLSIESGVSYTYLSSKSKSDKVTDILSKKQEFHYLGVPLSLNYSLANWNRFEVYASIGGVVQKDFYGRVIEKKYNSELLNWEESSKTNVSQMRPQLSATSSLGLSYPIYNKLRAYTTVGGAYYFDSDNEHQTIYSEKKWMLNLNLGLKIEF